MKFISPKAHSLLDYSTGLLLVTVPFLFKIDRHSAIFLAPLLLGVTTILISLATDYEGGLLKFIPLRLHLAIDWLSIENMF
jgi:hypothetical protein